MSTPSLKYLRRKETLLPYCHVALHNHFDSVAALELCFNQLPSDRKRDSFLKVAPYYLALVKNGDLVVDIPDSDPVVDYFTNTFKYIALMSLIESLADGKFIDCYSYLASPSRPDMRSVKKFRCYGRVANQT